MFKFIHAADIHLDSPLLGLEQYEGAPVDDIRGATRRALQNLVDMAVSEEVSFVIIAGDIYDGDWQDYSTGLHFASKMFELERHNIKVFIVSGNHDAESRITRKLQLPDNTHVFGAKESDTVEIKELKVAIHGRSFSDREITEDLSVSYPLPTQGFLNIGVLHTCADGREGFAQYAPCNVESLVAKGYDYWALGHIHKAEMIRETPYVVFPGNIQGRHVNETELDRQGNRTGGKGCKLVIVEDGQVVDVKHKVLDVVRWCQCQVTADAALTGDDVVSLCKDQIRSELEHTTDQLLAVRLTITGESEAHKYLAEDPDRWLNEIRNSVTGMAGGRVWLEKVTLKTLPTVDLDILRSQPGPLSDLIKFIDDIPNQEATIKSLVDSFGPVRGKTLGLPALDAGIEKPDVLGDRECVVGMLREVQYMLAQKLVQDGGLK